MNTAVEYKRPSHRNKYGEYLSKTFINVGGISGYIKISLCWFNGLGWYYAIELEAWNPMGKPRIIMENMASRELWYNGKDLPLCAQAAEDKAREICQEHGIVGLSFAPYILPRPRY